MDWDAEELIPDPGSGPGPRGQKASVIRIRNTDYWASTMKVEQRRHSMYKSAILLRSHTNKNKEQNKNKPKNMYLCVVSVRDDHAGGGGGQQGGPGQEEDPRHCRPRPTRLLLQPHPLHF
jgi:hypothetical protein